MMGRDFISTADKFRLRWNDGERVRVVRARLHSDDGTHPGVALFADQRLVLCITSAHARRLADMLHDELDRIEAEAEDT